MENMFSFLHPSRSLYQDTYRADEGPAAKSVEYKEQFRPSRTFRFSTQYGEDFADAPKIPLWSRAFSGTEYEGQKQNFPMSTKATFDNSIAEDTLGPSAEATTPARRNSEYQSAYMFQKDSTQGVVVNAAGPPHTVGVFPEQHVGKRQRESVTKEDFSGTLPAEPETSIEYQSQYSAKHEKKRSFTFDPSVLDGIASPHTRHKRKYWRNVSEGIIGPPAPSFQTGETTASKAHRPPNRSQELSTKSTKENATNRKVSFPLPPDHQTQYSLEYTGKALNDRFQAQKGHLPDYYHSTDEEHELPLHQRNERNTFWDSVSAHLRDELSVYKEQGGYGDLYSAVESRKMIRLEENLNEQQISSSNRTRRSTTAYTCPGTGVIPYERRTTYVEDIRGVTVPKQHRAKSPRSSIPALLDDDQMGQTQSEYKAEF